MPEESLVSIRRIREIVLPIGYKQYPTLWNRNLNALQKNWQIISEV